MFLLFLSFAKEITLFVFCLLFLYSFHVPLSIFLFSNFHTFSSFPLLLQQLPHSTTMFPYACMGLLTIHMTCAVSIFIFFICCQCSCTSRYFRSASAILSLTMLWYSSRLFLLELPYMHFWFKLLMPSFCCIKHMFIINNLCFGIQSSFGRVENGKMDVWCEVTR